MRISGWMSDVCSSDPIGILCSRQEGFANSILEGMAAGLPMIVTDAGGNAEAVVDGETGRVVPPHEPKILGEAILDLVNSPETRRRMGAVGKRRISETFSLQARSETRRVGTVCVNTGRSRWS